jgi:hypothetical protein
MTQRHRLNHGNDRQANSALHMAAISKIRISRIKMATADISATHGSASRAVVGQRSAGERRDDELGDVLGILGGIEEQVPAVNISPGKFAVHLASRPFVGEHVILSCPYPCEASLQRREKDKIVKAHQTGCRGEGRQKPGADYAVVNRHVSPAGIATCGSRGRLDDNVVLVFRLRKPRWDRTTSEEAEKRVTLDEGAGLEAVGKNACHR